MNKPIIFTVKGVYPFPLDMLRYDGCYPESTEDATAIHQSVTQYESKESLESLREGVTVTLITTRRQGPTEGRWESFGWKVTAKRVLC